MSLLKSLHFVLFTCLFAFSSFGQMIEVPADDDSFNDCAAILYKGKMLANTYSPEGKCKLEKGMAGKITVATVSLSEDRAIPIKEIGFKVAIKNKRTNTMLMYSDETFYEVELEDLLKACGKEDHLIFLTVDRKYALPHHEVEIVFGC